MPTYLLRTDDELLIDYMVNGLGIWHGYDVAEQVDDGVRVLDLAALRNLTPHSDGWVREDGQGTLFLLVKRQAYPLEKISDEVPLALLASRLQAAEHMDDPVMRAQWLLDLERTMAAIVTSWTNAAIAEAAETEGLDAAAAQFGLSVTEVDRRVDAYHRRTDADPPGSTLPKGYRAI
jgi:hypothetical protein